MSSGSPPTAESHHLLDDLTLRQDEPSISQYDSTSHTPTNIPNKMSMKDGTIEISTTQRMISATWGSILTSLLVTPLDVVRVRLQSQTTPTPTPLNLSKFPAYAANFEKLPADLGVRACCREVFWVGDNAQFCLAGNGAASSAVATDCAVEETQRRTFNSTYDGLRKIARNEGVSTLWRGLSPTLAMAIPANVIYFAGYEWLRFSRMSPIKRVVDDSYSPLVAGAVARVAAAIVVSPIEMFRTRMQATSGGTTGVFRDTLTGLYRMTQTQGYSSLWRGLTLTMWRDVPFSGIYWWGYEAIRHSLTEARDTAGGSLPDPSRSFSSSRNQQLQQSHTTTFIDSFTAGGISGAVAAFVTTPFDVGKTRKQVYVHAGDDAVSSTASAAQQQALKTAAKQAPEDMSMPRFLYHIFQEQGTSGLFKGWAARCLKVAPACAIMISSYEIGKRWAVTSNNKKDEERAQ